MQNGGEHKALYHNVRGHGLDSQVALTMTGKLPKLGVLDSSCVELRQQQKPQKYVEMSR